MLFSIAGSFGFNENGHKSWVTAGAKVYKKTQVIVGVDWAAEAERLYLNREDGIVQKDGSVIIGEC